MTGLSPEKQADDAIGLIWLCSTAGVALRVDGKKLIVRGHKGWPKEELGSLLRPYKTAIIHYLDKLAENLVGDLPVSVRADIERAFDHAGGLEL